MMMNSIARISALLLVGALAPMTASAQLPEGGYYSDFDAYFEVVSTQSGRDDTGWYLKAHGIVRADGIPAQSALEYVLEQGDRELLRVHCDAQLAQRELGYQIPEGHLGTMKVRGCNDRSRKLTAVGDMTVEVYFINGADDTRTLIRTHAIQVRRFNRANNAPQYYIAMNGEFASSVIHECTDNGCMGDRNSEAYIGLFYWAAPADDNGPVTDQSGREGPNDSDVQLRCSVDGTRLSISAKPRTAGVRNRSISVRHSFGEGHQDERVDYAFAQYQLRLPLSLEAEGTMPPGWVRVSEHSGAWECELRLSGRSFRTFRFQVTDGHIVATHPEEVAGGVRLQPFAHLLDMSVAADSQVDLRVTPVDAARGPFFGVGWQSDDGRTMGTNQPTIGEAHLPGEGGPRRGRRGRRGRRR